MTAFNSNKYLTDDFERHGKNLKKKFKWLPEINEPRFQRAEEMGLMPDQKNYEDWVNMFVPRKKKPSWWTKSFGSSNHKR